MKMIFVPVADRPECGRALRSAFALAKRLEANVVGCHMRPHRHSAIALSPYFTAELLGESPAAIEAVWQGKSTARSAEVARSLYESIAGDHGFPMIRRPRGTPGAIWQTKAGSPDRLMRIAGPVSDLIIVSRPRPNGGKVAAMFMLASLMESARPVLILPQAGQSRVGHRIAIAWNQSTEAARAVAAAMPLLQRADQVSIVTCGPEDRLGPKAAQLATYLKAWGIDGEHRRTRGRKVEQELLAEYRASRSDLLVMGAYSRSRWREIVFGGTSDHMLKHARIPVLMLHS